MTFVVSCKRDAKYFYCIQLKCGTKHLDPQSAHWLCKAWNRNLLYLVWTKTTLICSRAERRHSRRERQNSSGRSLGSKWKERYVDADSLLRNKPLLWRMIVTHSTETFRKHRHATKKKYLKTIKNGVIVNAGLDFVVTLPRLLQSNLFSVFFFKMQPGN